MTIAYSFAGAQVDRPSLDQACIGHGRMSKCQLSWPHASLVEVKSSRSTEWIDSVRVGIEIRAIAEPHAGGIVPHLQGLFAELCPSAPTDEFHFFGTIFNKTLFPPIAPNMRWHSLPLGPSYWARLDSLLRETRIDVLFRSFPLSDPLEFPLRKQVCNIPDLAHEALPHLFSAAELAERRSNFARMIQGSGAVGTNSHHARAMIREHYRSPFDDVFLMPSGRPVGPAAAIVASDAVRHSKFQSLRPFFYFPAKLWPHKNHATLLQAFALFRRSAPAHASFSLVLTGDPEGWEAFQGGHDTSGVTHLGYLTREDVYRLYENAAALVYPSLFEGFGAPVIEAFSFGCPVICSNAGSLPEVAQDAAIIVDPENPEALAHAMARIVSQEGLRQSLVAKGGKRCDAYSWQDSARALHDALERVHQRNASPLQAKNASVKKRLTGDFRPALAKASASIWKWLRGKVQSARLREPSVGSKARSADLPVNGFWLDGFLTPTSHFASEAVKSRRPLRLAGWSVVDAKVEILSGGQLIMTRTLVAERETILEFTATSDRLTLRFKPSAKREDGRAVAFFVTDTNLFSERELYGRPGR